MAPNVPPQVVSTIVTAALYRPDGVTLGDIVDAFPTPPDRGLVARWVRELVAAEVLDEYTELRPPRYFNTEKAIPYVPAGYLRSPH